MAYAKKYTKKTAKSTKKYTKKAPSKKVPVSTKKYVDRMIDRSRPDMHLKARHILEVPLDGPTWAPIFPSNTVGIVPVPFTDDGASVSSNGMINIVNSVAKRSDGSTDVFARILPRMTLHMKGLYISGQVSIPLALSNTPWAKIKIFVIEDKQWDPRQTTSIVEEYTPPGSNILMDKVLNMTDATWNSDDNSFTPTGDYTDLCASFNTNRFKLLGVTNVHVEQSTQDPTKNLRKFAIKCKHPQYLKFDKEKSNENTGGPSAYPYWGAPMNFKPIVLAYAVASDGSTTAATLQLDVDFSYEPPVN